MQSFPFPNLFTILAGWFALKFLLMNCYVSTDFEVHRNWLAITHNLPVDRWYYENTSIWTLDYPPFFAFFEYGLSKIGSYFLNSTSLQIRAAAFPTSDYSALIFQRLTVIFADIFYVTASIFCGRFVCGDGDLIHTISSTKKHVAQERKCLIEKWQMVNREQTDASNLKEKLANGTLKFLAGLDISTVDFDSRNAVACLTVLNFPELQVVHSINEVVEITAPYTPGFLAFREAPIMVHLVEKLRKERSDLLPEVIFIDGNGILHPERFGLACHVGILVDLPTVGVAKELHMIEDLVRPGTQETDMALQNAGDSLFLKTASGEVLGAAVLNSKQSKSPIYVSIGHKIDLETAVELSILCSRHRVPEPIRTADATSRELVRKYFL